MIPFSKCHVILDAEVVLAIWQTSQLSSVEGMVQSSTNQGALFSARGNIQLVFVGFKLWNRELLFLTWARLWGTAHPWNSWWNTEDKHFSFPFVWKGGKEEEKRTSWLVWVLHSCDQGNGYRFGNQRDFCYPISPHISPDFNFCKPVYVFCSRTLRGQGWIKGTAFELSLALWTRKGVQGLPVQPWGLFCSVFKIF